MANAAERRAEVEELADLAQYSCIYYELRIAKLDRCEFRIRLASALLGSAGVVAALKLFGSAATIGTGCAAGALGIYALVRGYAAEIKAAAAVQQKWIELRHQARRLLADGLNAETVAALREQFEEVEKAEAEKLRQADDKLREKAYKSFCEESGRIPPAGKSLWTAWLPVVRKR
jgi:hypothetical protein